MRALSAQDFTCLRDDDLFHAGIYRLKRVFQFGNHAALDDASVYILLESLAVYLWNDTLVVIFIRRAPFFSKQNIRVSSKWRASALAVRPRWCRHCVEDMPLFVVASVGQEPGRPLVG